MDKEAGLETEINYYKKIQYLNVELINASTEIDSCCPTFEKSKEWKRLVKIAIYNCH